MHQDIAHLIKRRNLAFPSDEVIEQLTQDIVKAIRKGK